jgi:ubiquinone/menaquinone biosynthesis C-methylase UbiE
VRQESQENIEASVAHKPALSSCFAGHHESVLRSHLSRTAQNSAQHLLPHIKSGMKILDIGCGPGTISRSLGTLVGPEGSVTGIDASEDVISQASKDIREHTNVSFEVGDAAKLRFEDSSFDIVHAHQVLQHVHDPVAILKEMRRLVKKDGGIISLREGDVTGTSIYPDPKSLYPQWVQVYVQTARASGADPQTGRKLHVLLREAGFRKIEVQVKAGSTTYGVNNPNEAKWWGDSWADRCLKSGFYDNALKSRIANEKELQNFSDMWREWGQSEDAWWAMLQGEAICIVKS